MFVISEIGADMGVLNRINILFLGWFYPANNESANKKNLPVVQKAGQYLKPLLIQCALAAVKSRKSYYAIKYNRLGETAAESNHCHSLNDADVKHLSHDSTIMKNGNQMITKPSSIHQNLKVALTLDNVIQFLGEQELIRKH